MNSNSKMKAAVLYGAKDIRVEPYHIPEVMPGMVLLRNRRVGVCGSDLHYFEHGYCAGFVPERPFILGHELTAEVAKIGDGVENVKVGDRVTVNPARSCGLCETCKCGRPNLCRKIIMLGSASSIPPTDGGLAEYVAVRSDQCHLLPSGIDNGIGAIIEPFAVALHAVKRVDSVSGKRVLVTGAGTIGLLAAVTSRTFGAVPVAVSDIIESRRLKALDFGVDASFNPQAPDFAARAREFAEGGFDVVFEASGSPRALRSAFELVRPGGTILQIGTIGTEDIPIPVNQILVNEVNLMGSMRYGDVFDEAIRLVASGRVRLEQFIDRVFALDHCALALEHAADKSSSLKIQIDL